ncbi:MAG: FTR1 family iron permease [Candidatus Ranarchaeia archaeon]
MIPQFLITFREGLEGAILIAILLGYLLKTERPHLTRFVWYGVFGAIVTSFMLSFFIIILYDGLTGPMKPLFEGITALFAVIVLTFMINWIAVQGPSLKQTLEQKTELIVQQGTIGSLVSFAFIAIFREGVETVLFLTPYALQDIFGTILGSFFGLLGAIIIAYSFVVVGKTMDLRRFFYYSGILLVFLAGGLLGYGIHELVEFTNVIGFNLGWIAQSAFTLPFSSEHIFHHKGLIGGIFATLFGYTVNPEWIRIIGQGLYLLIVPPLVINAYRKRKVPPSKIN